LPQVISIFLLLVSLPFSLLSEFKRFLLALFAELPNFVIRSNKLNRCELLLTVFADDIVAVFRQ
jgi:hypothetical protein